MLPRSRACRAGGGVALDVDSSGSPAAVPSRGPPLLKPRERVLTSRLKAYLIF